jgi:hypothetical protein
LSRELSGPAGLDFSDVEDVCGNDAVVVDVAAAGVSRPDLLLLRGEYQLMLVAAHPGDLRAARAAGLMTTYVVRPLEYGPRQRPHRIEDGEFDFTASDFLHLAVQLDT